MVEQRYQAVLAVISDGLLISQVASKVRVSRQRLYAWLARYEAQGLEGLADQSRRRKGCPHQMPAAGARPSGFTEAEFLSTAAPFLTSRPTVHAESDSSQLTIFLAPGLTTSTSG